MANKNKVKIQITHIKNMGRNHEYFCNNILLLRKARQVGDIEVVNHYQLGILNRWKGEQIDFEKVQD